MTSIVPMDFDNPTPAMISLDEIVSRLTREGANNIEPVSYSVAQHCMLVASACKLPASRPYALLHDTAKCWIGDFDSPFQRWLVGQGADVVALNRKILAATWQKFGLPSPTHDITTDIDHADMRAYATEYRDIVRTRHDAMKPQVPPLAATIGWKPQPKIEEQYRLALETALRPFARAA